MLRWFHALMPKEERFFDCSREHSRAVLAGAEALRAMLEGGDAIARNYQIVMDREHDADDVTREVLIAVRRTFITPFDRGNIRDLITSMDNSIDQMQKTAKSVMLFDVTTFTPQHEGDGRRHREMRAAGAGRPAAAAIDQQGSRLASATSPQQISALEGRADELHDEGLHELYRANAVGRQRAGLLRRQRGLRSSGKGGRPVRRRRQRDARHRDRARLNLGWAEEIAMDASLALCRCWSRSFSSRWRSTSSTACTMRPTRSPPSSRPACCARNMPWPGRRSSTSSPSCSSACTSPRRSAAASCRPSVVDPRVIFGALMGAISWNLITWYYGIPSSSSHALIGGLVGAGIAKARHRRRSSGAA